MLSHILEQPRTWILAHPETRLSQEQTHKIEAALARLEQGEPLPYVLGHWEFFGLDFYITPDVLIPRPETELLVERCLEWLDKHPTRRWIAEVGTGSGCIPVSLAKHLPDIKILTSDVSLSALKVAQQNLAKHQVIDRVYLLQSDLLGGIAPAPSRRFDLICANLPYIPVDTLKSLPISHWEPHLALSGGEDGMYYISRLFQEVPRLLAPAASIFIEIEASMGNSVRTLSLQHFPQASVTVLQDLAGKDRLVQVAFP